jgi:hypothetical protein
MEYSKLNGTGVAEFDETNPIKLCADLVYCGLKNNCFIKKEIEDFTQDDVLTWVDDMPMSQITDIIQVFEASAKQSQLVADSNEAMAASTSKANTEKPKK